MIGSSTRGKRARVRQANDDSRGADRLKATTCAFGPPVLAVDGIGIVFRGHRYANPLVAPAASPRISIVVTAHNQVDATLACLDSLARCSDDDPLEIIVVDNGSTDGTALAVMAWEAEPAPAGHCRRAIYCARDFGLATCNSLGLGAATGEFLVLLEPHSQLKSGWIRTLLGHLGHAERTALPERDRARHRAKWALRMPRWRRP